MAGENISPGDAHRRLRRVYILDSNSTEALEFQRISPAESLIEMVKHAFLPGIEAQAMLAARFDERSGLAQLPIFCRRGYPRRFEALLQVRQTIIEHATQGSEDA